MYSKADCNRQIRLGLLVPAGNTTFEPDFHSAFSSQVTIHSHRVIAQRSHAYESYESNGTKKSSKPCGIRATVLMLTPAVMASVRQWRMER